MATQTEIQTITSRALFDNAYRYRLLENPKKAAEELSIKLTGRKLNTLNRWTPRKLVTSPLKCKTFHIPLRARCTGHSDVHKKRQPQNYGCLRFGSESSADQRVDQKDADEFIQDCVNQRSTCNKRGAETATESLKGQVGPSCTTLRNVTSVLVRFDMSAVRVASRGLGSKTSR